MTSRDDKLVYSSAKGRIAPAHERRTQPGALPQTKASMPQAASGTAMLHNGICRIIGLV